MKDFYISDAPRHENQVVTSYFCVTSKQVKPRRNGGENYIALTLGDRSGHLDAKMWDNVPDYVDTFEQDDFVKVKGLINRYNGRMQLTVHMIRKLHDQEVDFGDFLPKTSSDIDQLWQTLQNFVASIKNDHLRNLLNVFIADPEIATAYRTAPAAKTLHHAYIGGLLEHVVSLMRSCDLLTPNYPHVNRDVVMAGIFFHDLGKIHELTYQRSFGYSTEGQLLGHIVLVLEMLQKKLQTIPDFPNELKRLLEHLIVSHHGQYEFGSPKLPMTPEALMLHYLDDLDSKMESMRAHFEREAMLENEWTSYNTSLGRPLLNVKKYLAGEDK